MLIQGDSKMITKTVKRNFDITHAATEAPVNAAQIILNMLRSNSVYAQLLRLQQPS